MQAKTNKEGAPKTKYQHLTRNETNYNCQRKTYLTKLNRIDASTIFKARTRMLDIKENFSNKPGNKMCRACNNEEETIRHVLQECRTIHKDQNLIVEQDDIFVNDIPYLKLTAKNIREIIDKLTENDKKSGEDDQDNENS